MLCLRSIQIRQVEWIAPAIVSATILGVLVETGIIRISGFVGIGHGVCKRVGHGFIALLITLAVTEAAAITDPHAMSAAIQIRQVEWIAPAIVSATILGVVVETGIIRISGFVGIGLLKQSTILDEDQLIDTLVGDCDKIRDILLCHCEAEKMIILVTGSAAVGSYKYLGIVYNIRNMISSMIAESESDYTLCSYCHRIKPCRGPNNICTECINQMRVSASLD